MLLTMLLWALLIILVVADTVMTAMMFVRLYANAAEERLEREVGEKMARDRVDEGFENIMRFSVNGTTGFESEE